MPESEWIFFTSKNSVKFFFQKKYALGNQKFACVGKGTYKELAKHIKVIDFVGDAVDVKEVGEAFSKLVGDKKCVFPVSNISKRTIQSYFENQDQVEDLVVYKTEERQELIDPKADVLIFTSPSNARAYFSKLDWQPHQKVIVMGPTTAQQVKELGIEKYLLPKITGEMGLIDLI